MEDNRARSTWTLGAIKARGLRLEGHCDPCGWFATFDVERMIAAAGPDYLVPEIIPGIPCAVCGGPLAFKLAMVPPEAPSGEDAPT